MWQRRRAQFENRLFATRRIRAARPNVRNCKSLNFQEKTVRSRRCRCEKVEGSKLSRLWADYNKEMGSRLSKLLLRGC